ncbi:MAG: hypothetical protein WDM88_00360 [Galbitalea sp.]
MGLLALASTGIVLTTVWGGTTYKWDSLTIISLIAGTVLAAVLFVLVERKAVEPIMPPAPVPAGQLQPDHDRRTDHRHRHVRCARLPADLPARWSPASTRPRPGFC